MCLAVLLHIPACVGQTDRNTTTANTALAYRASRGKNVFACSSLVHLAHYGFLAIIALYKSTYLLTYYNGIYCGVVSLLTTVVEDGDVVNLAKNFQLACGVPQFLCYYS